MSYRINKSNGDVLTDLIDGVLDTTTTDLALIGQNYKNFGEALNENFVKLLENFASTSAPENALLGQLWFDIAQGRLLVYNGETFVSANGNIVGDVASNSDIGDIFIDTSVDQLKFYNGTEFITVGPNYTKAQGKTNIEAVTMTDTVGAPKTVAAHYVNGVLVGITSRTEFTPSTASNISPYPANTAIKIGFNPVDTTNFRFRGTADTTSTLVGADGNNYSPTDFVRVNQRDSSNNLVDQNIESGLFVKGTSGVSIGYQDAKYGTFKVDTESTNTVIDVERLNFDFAIRVLEDGSKINAVFIDSSEKRVGIFTSTPTSTLDVAGTVTATEFIGDFKGTIVADDSTILVDAVNGAIPAANLTGALPAIDGSALTGISSSGGSGSFTDVTVSGDLTAPTIITPDSSALLIQNIANFQSDAIVDGRLSVGGQDIEDLIGDGTGGYEFTAGFENRTTGQAGVSDIGTDVEYTAAQVLTQEWMRFGFSYERQVANDKPYWTNGAGGADEAPGAIYGADPGSLPDGFFMDGANARPESYRGVGLFSGAYMPTGVTSMFDFAEDSTFSPYNQAQTSGSLLYNAASGSYDMSQLNTGDFCSFRFDFNLTPQFANTTVEVGLIWQTRDSDDNATFTFALTGEPIFFGAGTTGRTFLNRPIMTAYLASIEDVNARALPAIRADQPVFVQPLTTLFVVGR